MSKPPRPVRVVAWLQVIVGVLGIVIPLAGVVRAGHIVQGALTVASINAVWLLSGVLLLRRVAWARWVALVWVALHIGVAARHSVAMAVLHGLLLPIFAYALFSRESAAWFREPTSPA